MAKETGVIDLGDHLFSHLTPIINAVQILLFNLKTVVISYKRVFRCVSKFSNPGNPATNGQTSVSSRKVSLDHLDICKSESQ